MIVVRVPSEHYLVCTHALDSHRQGLFRTTIRRVLPPYPPCKQAKDRYTRQSRYDNTHNHAYFTARSGSYGVQNES